MSEKEPLILVQAPVTREPESEPVVPKKKAGGTNNIVFLGVVLAALFFLPEILGEKDSVEVDDNCFTANARAYSASWFAFFNEPTTVTPDDDVDPDVCPRCLGEGHFGDGAHRQVCPDCNGTGKRTDTAPDEYSGTPSPSVDNDNSAPIPDQLPDNSSGNQIPDEFYAEAEDVEVTPAEAEDITHWRNKPLKEMTKEEIDKLTPVELERKVSEDRIDSWKKQGKVTEKSRYLLYFKADWCKFCKKQDDALRKLEPQGWHINKRPSKGGIKWTDDRISFFHIIQVDADEREDLVKRYGLNVLPSWVLIDDKNTKFKVVNGTLSAAEISDFYNTLEPPER